MLAILYFDSYLKWKKNIEVEALTHIAIVALALATKISDSSIEFSYENANKMTDANIGAEMYSKIELVMTRELDFNFNIPTPYDFITYLVNLSNLGDDLGELVCLSQSFAFIQLTGMILTF